MCGIAALFSTSSCCQTIKKMTDCIQHRGPDDEGFFFFYPDGTSSYFGGADTPSTVYGKPLPYAPKDAVGEDAGQRAIAALGHRRLAIVDLTPTGHQPLCCSDQRYWITYNGEIYNHLEIKVELLEKGYHFFSNSDTEVLLAAYREWGEAFLHRLNGMFAFVIFDTQERRVFAARDRFGIKPLYYWQGSDGALALGSEIKQFTALDGWKAQLNHQMAYEFLQWGLTDHSEQTLFRGVHQLRGGESLSYVLGEGVEINCWYTLPTEYYKGSLHDAAEEFYALFEDAVRLRLRADVSVGSCLSGGLDSSSIVCLANHLLRKESGSVSQATFSACSHEKRFDERGFMEHVVAQTGVRPHYIYPALEMLFEELDRMTWFQEQPFGSTSVYAQWCIFGEVQRQNIKVMLDGQGADEQLVGYDNLIAPALLECLGSGKCLDVVREIGALRRTRPGLKPLLRMVHYALPDQVKQAMRRFGGKTSSHATWIEKNRLSFSLCDPHRQRVPVSGFQRQAAYTQIMRTNLPMLLRVEDRSSMAHSVEARVPFLDHRLVAFTQSLPSEYKIFKGVSKAVLRQGLCGLLPPAIHQRTCKLGFCTPEEVWMRQEQPEQFCAAIRDAIRCSEGILGNQAQRVAEQILQGKKAFDFTPWRMISFGRWMKRFEVAVD